MRPPLRSALLNLRVKDLQHYLNQHNVSTRGCLEKEDLVNVVLRYASNSGNPNVGNPGYHPGSSSYASAGNPRNIQSENSTSPPPGNTTSSSGPSSTTPSSSVPRESHPRPQPDSDSSSSDTSFEMVQRPSSNENITGTNSSSTSTSTPSSPSPVSEEESATTADASALPLEGDITTALSSTSLSHEFGRDSTEASEATPEADTHNPTQHETLEVNSNSQPSVSESSSSNNSPNLIRGTMASITSETDFEALSVKQLKDILHRHRVNYHGCCEKAELVERAKRLYRDYLASRAELEKLELDALCKICMDAPVECVMLECGHMATCTDCGRQLSECPICRQFVVRIVRTFKA